MRWFEQLDNVRAVAKLVANRRRIRLTESILGSERWKGIPNPGTTPRRAFSCGINIVGAHMASVGITEPSRAVMRTRSVSDGVSMRAIRFAYAIPDQRKTRLGGLQGYNRAAAAAVLLELRHIILIHRPSKPNTSATLQSCVVDQVHRRITPIRTYHLRAAHSEQISKQYVSAANELSA